MPKLTVLDKFGTCPNSILNDPNLSLKAKGLWTFMQSKPDDWHFTIRGIAVQCRDGIDSIRAAIQELVAYKLLTARKFNTSGGWDVEYLLYSPGGKSPGGIFPGGKSPGGKIQQYSNKELSNKELSKKEDKGEDLSSLSHKFQKPNIEDVKSYCLESKKHIDPEQFIDFYESKGWKVGNSPMKDWKAAVRNWARREPQAESTTLVHKDREGNIVHQSLVGQSKSSSVDDALKTDRANLEKVQSIKDKLISKGVFK